MSPFRPMATKALSELGLVSLYRSPRDVKLLCLQRLARLGGYGGAALVLVSFLTELQISKTRAGIFMTLTLAGDVVFSLALTLCADALGRRLVLAGGSLLMVLSGITFALSSNYFVLLAAAVFGVISPAGNEIGPFRAVEESAIAHLTTPAQRGDVYAWYGLLGNGGAAIGMVACGWAVQRLHDGSGWDLLRAYRVVFWVYAGLGLVKLILALLLSKEVEVKNDKRPVAPAATVASAPSDASTPVQSSRSSERSSETATEQTPLLAGDDSDDDVAKPPDEDDDPMVEEPKGLRRLLPKISDESIKVMVGLAFLFALDSFASGIAPLSWYTFYFHDRFSIPDGTLGSIFFVTSIIQAFSMLLSSSLAKRFGNVNTMVFTHLPSSILLILIGVSDEVHWSLLFLILRSCTSSMDTAPRSAFLAAIILPQERTAIMGFVNVVKTMAQTFGPWITGILGDMDKLWVIFIISGTLKSCYDLGILALYKNHEREREDRLAIEGERRAEASARDGEEVESS